MTNALYEQARAVNEDQTKAPEGTFREPHPAGPTLARMCGYVELGKRPQSYAGKAKQPAVDAFVYFELLGPKHVKDVEVEGGGTRRVANVVRVRISKKLGDKSAQTLLLRKLAYGRDDKKNIVSMLGEGFLVTVVHNSVTKTVNGKEVTTVYANIKDKDGSWLIGAPSITDPLTGDTTVLEVPAGVTPPKLLLWEQPTQMQWDSIFIDGTYTKKDDAGNEVEVSKNWMQEDIIANALDFSGSPLEALLAGVGDMDLEATQVPETTPAAPAPAPAAAPAAAPAEPAPAEPEQAAPASQSAEDLLAALGVTA